MGGVIWAVGSDVGGEDEIEERYGSEETDEGDSVFVLLELVIVCY